MQQEGAILSLLPLVALLVKFCLTMLNFIIEKIFSKFLLHFAAFTVI